MSNFKRAGRIGLGVILFAGVATAALAQPVGDGAPAAGPAPAVDPREARIDQLEAEVQDLASEVADLKRGQAAQIDTLSTVETKIPPKPLANLSIPNGVPTISSTDGKFTARFHGIVQLDAGINSQAAPGPLGTDLRRDGPAVGATTSNVDALHARDLKDGVDFRRARIGLDGVLFGNLDYRLIFDFAGTGVENAGQLYEGWVQYSGFKPLHLRVGAFAPSIGLDDQDSTNGMLFLERSASADLARGLAAGDTRIGAQLFGYGDHWLASAAVTGRTVGVVNTGTVSATPQTYSDQLGFVGRLAGTPFHGSDWLVHFGVHGSYVDSPANTCGPVTATCVFSNGTPTPALTSYGKIVDLKNTPELRVDATTLIDTGKVPAKNASTVGLEFAAQKKNFFLQSEYEQFEISRSDIASNPTFHGFYVEGSWIITGETRKYNSSTAAFDAPPVAHPFNPGDGGWGAWELGLRYSDLNLNYHAGALLSTPAADAIRGGDESIWTAGLNWYLNPAVRFMFDYQRVTVNRLAGLSAAWGVPTGSQIGQSYNAFSVRSQFAF